MITLLSVIYLSQVLKASKIQTQASKPPVFIIALIYQWTIVDSPVSVEYTIAYYLQSQRTLTQISYRTFEPYHSFSMPHGKMKVSLLFPHISYTISVSLSYAQIGNSSYIAWAIISNQKGIHFRSWNQWPFINGTYTISITIDAGNQFSMDLTHHLMMVNMSSVNKH